MPYRPKKPCAFPGCPNLAAGKYCAMHAKTGLQQQRDYNHNVRRPDSNSDYGRHWREVRARYAQQHPLCEECLKRGKLVPLDEVHHKLPLSRGGTHSPANLESLCKSCHTRIHRELGDR